MSPVKHSSTELFFPSNEATGMPHSAPEPDSLVRRGLSHLTRLSLLLWSLATFITTVVVMYCIITDLGLVPSSFIDQYVFANRSAQLRAVGSSTHSLEQFDQRLHNLESRLDFLDRTLEPLPKSHLNTLSSRLEAAEAHVQSLSTLVEGAHPRNVALWADGARHIKALTSPTYEAKRSGLLQYVWRTKDTFVPPSHVLNGAPTSYCWEFPGSRGQFAARLSEKSRITSLSIFHAHRRTLSSLAASKAPKSFTLWGLYPDATSIPQGAAWKPASDFLKSSSPPSDMKHNNRFISLINGTYDQTSSQTRQYFNVSSSLLSMLLQPVDVVVLEVLSNWGSNTTCLYGLGLHVEPVE